MELTKVNLDPNLQNNGGGSGNAGAYFAYEEDEKKKKKEFLEEEYKKSLALTEDVFVSSESKETKFLFTLPKGQLNKVKNAKLELPYKNEPLEKAFAKLRQIEKIIGKNSFEQKKVAGTSFIDTNQNIFMQKQADEKNNFKALIESIKKYF